MIFSKAEEEPVEEPKETEISETRYMGEGPPGAKPRDEETEVSETAYMGEPEEREEPKHETEYNEQRRGPKVGKATLERKKKEEKKKPA